MTSRDYLTIGEVVQRLESAYPDLSISKVRFLEDEGLVAPERTSGGYRKFSQADVARVEMILRLQRDHFLPLAVIREKLADFDRGRIPPELQRSPVGMTEPLPLVAEDMGPILFEAAPAALGVPASFLRELTEFGLIEIKRDDAKREIIERADVQIVHATWDLRRFGVEPRHLRMYENFAEREAALFSQILMPSFRHRTPETKQKLAETLNELGSLTADLKDRLLRRSLGRAFEDLNRG
ncbi:MAG: MerR family transcriptional regulator [Coriobacteriia bacterium]|nr:MerR family transcriptional regulator [Coriobacteriia bacterium]